MTKGFDVMVECSTSVFYAVGAKVVGSILYVAEIIFGHIYYRTTCQENQA